MKTILRFLMPSIILLLSTLAFAQPNNLSLVAPIPVQVTIVPGSNVVEYDFATVFYSNELDPRETYTLTWDVEYRLENMPGFEANFNFDQINSNISPTPTPNANNVPDGSSKNQLGITDNNINDTDHGELDPFGVVVDLISLLNEDDDVPPPPNEDDPDDPWWVDLENGNDEEVPRAIIEFTNGQIVSTSGITITLKDVIVRHGLTNHIPMQQLLTSTTQSLVDPNPVVSTATIATAVSSVTVLDLQGKTWFSSKASGANQSINLSHLPAGMYIMRAQTAKGIKQEMIFKE